MIKINDEKNAPYADDMIMCDLHWGISPGWGSLGPLWGSFWC